MAVDLWRGCGSFDSAVESSHASETQWLRRHAERVRDRFYFAQIVRLKLHLQAGGTLVDRSIQIDGRLRQLQPASSKRYGLCRPRIVTMDLTGNRKCGSCAFRRNGSIQRCIRVGGEVVECLPPCRIHRAGCAAPYGEIARSLCIQKTLDGS